MSAPANAKPTPGDDAAETKLVPVAEIELFFLNPLGMAFPDHKAMLRLVLKGRESQVS
jgi:hypothetical protein